MDVVRSRPRVELMVERFNGKGVTLDHGSSYLLMKRQTPLSSTNYSATGGGIFRLGDSKGVLNFWRNPGRYSKNPRELRDACVGQCEAMLPLRHEYGCTLHQAIMLAPSAVCDTAPRTTPRIIAHAYLAVLGWRGAEHAYTLLVGHAFLR